MCALMRMLHLIDICLSPSIVTVIVKYKDGVCMRSILDKYLENGLIDRSGLDDAHAQIYESGLHAKMIENAELFLRLALDMYVQYKDFSGCCLALFHARADTVAVSVGSYHAESDSQIFPVMFREEDFGDHSVQSFNLDTQFAQGLRRREDLSSDSVDTFVSGGRFPEYGSLGFDERTLYILNRANQYVAGIEEAVRGVYHEGCERFITACDKILGDDSRRLMLINYTNINLFNLFLTVSKRHIDLIGSRLAVVQGYFLGQPVLVHSAQALMSEENTAEHEQVLWSPVPEALKRRLWGDTRELVSSVPIELGELMQSLDDMTVAFCFNPSLAWQDPTVDIRPLGDGAQAAPVFAQLGGIPLFQMPLAQAGQVERGDNNDAGVDANADRVSLITG